MILPVHVGPDDPAEAKRERDLYRRLLELRHKEEIDPFLDDALELIVEVSGASRGYIELADERSRSERASFWLARGCSDEDIEEIRGSFSRGVIAEAIASGTTIVTASAMDDPRFKRRGSVRRNRIEAVLCAPIGAGPPLGVLYLQGRVKPGTFSDGDRALAEIFASTLSVIAERLLMRRRLRQEQDPTQPYRRSLRAEGIVGRSQALAWLLQRVSVAAPLDVGVLLTGPSGTGKTRVARLIHDSSPRAGGPFIELNCATLGESLFESELFGAMPGAHSTASRKVDGKVTAAERGTLFLDEIGEVSLASQAKLLQLLESKEYYPLGSARPLRADVRIVAATNVDLHKAVQQRSFREDLYYRLEVMPIAVPTLGERRDDIPELVRHFCSRAVESFKLPVLEPSDGLLRAAEAAEWPGNLRQLANAIQRAAVTAAGEGVVRVERRHLFPDDAASRGRTDPPGARSRRILTFQDATRAFQSELLREALEEAEWSVTETAARLDLTRAHVYNLIKAFGLSRAGA